MDKAKTTQKRRKAGRPKSDNPAEFRYTINLAREENARFLAQFEASGMKIMAHYITACIFGKTVKVVKVDKGSIDYCIRLTQFYSQFRAVGVNYNQVTKAIKNNFSERKALAFLSQLEKATLELVAINKQVMDLTREFEEKYLDK